jgi:hypothetical protein
MQRGRASIPGMPTWAEGGHDTPDAHRIVDGVPRDGEPKAWHGEREAFFGAAAGKSDFPNWQSHGEQRNLQYKQVFVFFFQVTFFVTAGNE